MSEVKEVKYVEQATEIAASFLKKYDYHFIRPIKAVREGDVWLVEIDVGIYTPRIAQSKVDVKTAMILDYMVPPLGG